MILDDFADYLTSQGVLTSAEVYAGFMPENPDQVVALYETGGLPPIHAFSPVPGAMVVERPRLQVVFRCQPYDYQAARLRANAAYLAIDGMGDRSINGVRYLWAGAVSAPFPMGRDGVGRVLLACNFDVVKEKSTA